MDNDITETLEAIETLIEHYSRYRPHQVPLSYHNKYAENCPLCQIFRDCVNCPWVKCEGDKCVELDYSRHKTYTRIARLNKWKKLIEEERNT